MDVLNGSAFDKVFVRDWFDLWSPGFPRDDVFGMFENGDPEDEGSEVEASMFGDGLKILGILIVTPISQRYVNASHMNGLSFSASV